MDRQLENLRSSSGELKPEASLHEMTKTMCILSMIVGAVENGLRDRNKGLRLIREIMEYQ
jgi:hypothetical protein